MLLVKMSQSSLFLSLLFPTRYFWNFRPNFHAKKFFSRFESRFSRHLRVFFPAVWYLLTSLHTLYDFISVYLYFSLFTPTASFLDNFWNWICTWSSKSRLLPIHNDCCGSRFRGWNGKGANNNHPTRRLTTDRDLEWSLLTIFRIWIIALHWNSVCDHLTL